jgi:hypothetical protein
MLESIHLYVFPLLLMYRVLKESCSSRMMVVVEVADKVQVLVDK